jgi:hypothetical protein
MIGARGIGAGVLERVREMERDKEEERELLPPSLLRSLSVLVNVSVGNENTFVLTFRKAVPLLGGAGNDLFLPNLTIPCLSMYRCVLVLGWLFDVGCWCGCRCCCRCLSDLLGEHLRE